MEILQAPVFHTHCVIWWRIGDDQGVIQQGYNGADYVCERFLEGNLLPSALMIFDQGDLQTLAS